MDNLQDLFEEQLKDVYNAEKQLVKALPRMAKAAKSPNLKAAFQKHLEQTKEQVARIEQVCELVDSKTGRKKCAAMEGLIEEGAELIEEGPVGEVMDAGLIAAAQRIEHYEMAAYGTLCGFAKQLGHAEALTILQTTLDEEKLADQILTDLAEGEINAKAMIPAKAG